jgi:hypothetical protein
MIERIGDFLLHNLVVLLAVVLVPMKWVILRICGDSEAQAVALLSVPEDLCYVLLGLILGDLTNSEGAFRKYFRASAHATMNILVTAGINVILAIFIHMLSKWSADHFKTWRAARELQARPASETVQEHLPLPLTATEMSIGTIQIRSFTSFTLLYAFQLVISIWWLEWIARIVANPTAS